MALEKFFTNKIIDWQENPDFWEDSEKENTIENDYKKLLGYNPM